MLGGWRGELQYHLQHKLNSNNHSDTMCTDTDYSRTQKQEEKLLLQVSFATFNTQPGIWINALDWWMIFGELDFCHLWHLPCQMCTKTSWCSWSPRYACPWRQLQTCQGNTESNGLPFNFESSHNWDNSDTLQNWIEHWGTLKQNHWMIFERRLERMVAIPMTRPVQNSSCTFLSQRDPRVAVCQLWHHCPCRHRVTVLAQRSLWRLHDFCCSSAQDNDSWLQLTYEGRRVQWKSSKKYMQRYSVTMTTMLKHRHDIIKGTVLVTATAPTLFIFVQLVVRRLDPFCSCVRTSVGVLTTFSERPSTNIPRDGVSLTLRFVRPGSWNNQGKSYWYKGPKVLWTFTSGIHTQNCHL